MPRVAAILVLLAALPLIAGATPADPVPAPAEEAVAPTPDVVQGAPAAASDVATPAEPAPGPEDAAKFAAGVAARLDGFASAQRDALASLAYREAYRKTRDCLALEVTEPFCAAVAAGDAKRCATVPVRDEGAVHSGSCAVAVAIRAARSAADDDPCGALDGGVADLCRMVAADRYDCGSVDGGADDPPGMLCRLLADPSRCAGAKADAGEMAQACALTAFLRGVAGDGPACEGIPAGRFPRLRAACRVAGGVEDECPPSGTDTPALARCAVAEAWPPDVSRTAKGVVVDAAVANVLSHELRCYAETRLEPPRGAPIPLPDVPLDPIPPGAVTLQRITVPAPADAVGTPVAHARCAWKDPHPGALPKVAPYAGPMKAR